MNKRPELDTENPPGQIVNPVGQSSGGVRYLRDVIRKYQDEDRAQERAEASQATLSSTPAEKRLQAVLAALAGLARQAELRQGTYDGWWAQELRKILEEV